MLRVSFVGAGNLQIVPSSNVLVPEPFAELRLPFNSGSKQRLGELRGPLAVEVELEEVLGGILVELVVNYH